MLRPWLAALLHRYAERLVPPAPQIVSAGEAPAASTLEPIVRALLRRHNADGVAVLLIVDTGIGTYKLMRAAGVAAMENAELLSYELSQLAEFARDLAPPPPSRVAH